MRHRDIGCGGFVRFAKGLLASLAPMTQLDTRAISSLRGPHPAGRSQCARASGFTLIEMLMTIAVAAILLVIAVPSFRYVTNSNRIASEINGLLGDLQFARAEAIKDGQTVTVCVSSNSTTCDGVGTTTWQNGWIVYQNPANILRVQAKFANTDSFQASNGVFQIQFNREGYAAGMPNGTTLISLHDSTNNTAWTRCLAINFSGQMTSELFNTVNNGTTCT